MAESFQSNSGQESLGQARSQGRAKKAVHKTKTNIDFWYNLSARANWQAEVSVLKSARSTRMTNFGQNRAQ